MENRTIILASGSPRRLELLRRIGIEPVVVPSRLEETPTAVLPSEVVQELSLQKASDIAEIMGRQIAAMWKEHEVDPEAALASMKNEKDILVIGADTVVAVDDEVLGKPESHEDAARMIRMIEGRQHSVFTGVTLIRLSDRKVFTFAEETKVHVYPMTADEIEAYAESEEPMDKAGAYGIQGTFAAYIKGIEGDYTNVVGLPVGAVYQALKKI